MDYDANIKYLFPKTNKIKDLKTDDEGEYSISRPEDAKHITKLIKNKLLLLNMKKNIVITDATAGIGGNTISFCKNFKKVYAIELNKNRYNYLINNLKIFELENNEVINGDMLDVIPNLEQDIIFADPPWGGKDYIKHDELDLFINNMEISKVTKDILDKKYCKLMVLKLPYNYNMKNLDIFEKNEYKISKYLIRKKILVLLINKLGSLLIK